MLKLSSSQDIGMYEGYIFWCNIDFHCISSANYKDVYKYNVNLIVIYLTCTVTLIMFMLFLFFFVWNEIWLYNFDKKSLINICMLRF